MPTILRGVTSADAVLVELNRFEDAFAVWFGNLRQDMAAANAIENRAHADDEASMRAYHVAGMRAEMAVAKYWGLYIDGTPGRVRAADVGQCFEVRAPGGKAKPAWIRERDHKFAPYVCAWVNGPRIYLRGWYRWSDVADLKLTLKDPDGRGDPAYWFENEHLRPIKTLEVSTVVYMDEQPADPNRICGRDDRLRVRCPAWLIEPGAPRPAWLEQLDPKPKADEPQPAEVKPAEAKPVAPPIVILSDDD